METWLTVETWLPRILLAILLGGVVGFERQYHGRAAGLRTHILVCLGAALITLASFGLIGAEVASASSIRSDPARIAAGVITGIGFLGGGVIMRFRDHVRGLTTAASIWFTAGLGVIIGLGFTTMAVTTTVLEQVTLVGLAYFEKFIPTFHYRDLLVTAAGKNMEIIEDSCRAALDEFAVKVSDIECEFMPGNDQVKLVFHLKLRGKRINTEIIRRLSALDGVKQIAWRHNIQQT
ncbi:MAG: MgtC/SapB family protein [Kiritimatiellia bacterium]